MVILKSFTPPVLELFHTEYFGNEKMKKRTRTTVYWQKIDDAVKAAFCVCQLCAGHRDKQFKPAIYS